MAVKFSFRKKKKSAVGIELGGHTLKMVEVLPAGESAQVLSYGVREIPPDIRGRSSRDIQAISGLVKQLLDTCKFAERQVFIGVSGPSVNLQRIKLPPMPDKEILPAIILQGKKQFPFSLQDARILYKKLSAPAKGGSAEQEIFVSAAQVKFVDRELDLFRRIGVEPDGVDTDAAAIQHVLKFGSTDSRRRTIAFLDVGADQTTLSIFKENEIQFSRQIATGGNDITQALMEPFSSGGKSFAFKFDEAQEIKTIYGIPMGSAEGVTPQGIPLSRIMFMVRPVLEKLITETLRSFDFYKAQTREKSIDEVFLCGGSAGLANLADVLSGGLGIPVSVFNPFEHMLVPLEIRKDHGFLKNRHQLAVAAGLALGGGRGNNFMPPKPGGFSTTDLKAWIPAFAMIVFLFALYTVYGMEARAVKDLQLQLKKRKADLAALNVSVEGLVQLTARRDRLQEKLEQYPDFYEKQPAFERVFVLLSRSFPGSVSLDRIALQEVKAAANREAGQPPAFTLKVSGFAAGQDYAALGVLSQAAGDMERSAELRNVMIESSEKIQQLGRPGIRFVIKCDLTPDVFT